jgi:hypothetical protein
VFVENIYGMMISLLGRRNRFAIKNQDLLYKEKLKNVIEKINLKNPNNKSLKLQ